MNSNGSQILLLFVGGLAFFLYGILLLQKGLKKSSGKRLRTLVNYLTGNRITGVFAGGAITAILQSSSAATVMFVSLASAGVLSLVQCIPLILGAGIGTTITVQIISFKLSSYSLLLIGLGVLFLLFTKSRKMQHIGQIIIGFGLVFYGMHIMGQASAPLKGSGFAASSVSFLKNYPIYGLILGAVFTAIVQSSAATIGLVISLGQSGVIDLPGAVPIILGANVGTCATALLASIASNVVGKRVAMIHILLKVVASLICFALLTPFVKLISSTTPILTHQMANAHTIFNIALALVFLPFTQLIGKLGNKLLASEERKEKAFSALFLDKSALSSTTLAFASVQREILRMAEFIQQMIEQMYLSYSKLEDVAQIKQLDDKVDILYEDIKLYLAKLSQDGFDDEEAKQYLYLLDVTTNIEGAGDILSKNIVNLLKKKSRQEVQFSEQGLTEIRNFHQQVFENFKKAMAAFTTNDRQLAAEVTRQKKEVRAWEEKLRLAHISRLSEGLQESLDTSDLHLELIANLKQLNSVITRIVKPLALATEDDES